MTTPAPSVPPTPVSASAALPAGPSGGGSTGGAGPSTSHSSGPAPPPKRVPVPTGIYPVDSIKTIGESVGIAKLDDQVAVALAGDVEFRIHQLIEEAQKFMRHSRRSTMLPSDINHALQALNVEPLYGHLPLPSSSGQPSFVPLRTSDVASSSKSKSSSSQANNASSSSSADQFYYLEDHEISFDELLKTKPPGLVGGGVRWTAHWLAVEGVMPNVPENVAMDYHKAHAEGTDADLVGGGSTVAGVGASAAVAKGSTATGSATAAGGAAAGKGDALKLSQELNLYYKRLTKALLPEGGDAASIAVGKDGELSSAERARLAALASLRGDTGLQGLVVYLVRWIGDKITESLHHLSDLPALLDTIHALLSNQTLFLEPYLHQLLPPLLSPLLTYPLGSDPAPQANGASSSSRSKSEPTASEIRVMAANVLGALVHEFGSVYETLVPRLTKTLLRSLAPPNPSGRVEGALLGLGAIGKEAVRRGLWGSDHPLSSEAGDLDACGKGIRSWGESWDREASWTDEERKAVFRAATSSLQTLLPRPTRPATLLSAEQVTDPAAEYNLRAAFGDGFAGELTNDKWLADSLLDMVLARDQSTASGLVVGVSAEEGREVEAGGDATIGADTTMDGDVEAFMEPGLLEGLIQGMDAGPIGEEEGAPVVAEAEWVEPMADETTGDVTTGVAGSDGADGAEAETEDADMEEVA